MEDSEKRDGARQGEILNELGGEEYGLGGSEEELKQEKTRKQNSC